MAADIIPTTFLCLAVAIVLIMNVLFIVVFIRRKRLRTPSRLPVSMVLVHLACIDLIAALLWTLYTAISAATGSWIITDSKSSSYDILCRQQVYIMTFCNLINAHTLMVLMFERFLFVFKPSKHQEVVFDFVVLLLLVSLYVFDGVISTFPLWGFGELKYFSDQYQCAVDYAESTSHFQFTLTLHFCLPITVIVGLYVAILIRVHILKKRRAPNGAIVLEENLNAVGDSYSDRLKEQNKRFHGAGARAVKPKVKDTTINKKDGFVSDDEDFNSSDEEKSKSDDVAVMSRDYSERSTRKRQRKMYYLSRSDLREAHMYALISAAYFAMWIPYIIRSILYTYHYYTVNISSMVALTTVCISHFCSCFKLPFYLLSDRLRGAIMKTLGFGSKGGKNKKDFEFPHKDNSLKHEETTEL